MDDYAIKEAFKNQADDDVSPEDTLKCSMYRQCKDCLIEVEVSSGNKYATVYLPSSDVEIERAMERSGLHRKDGYEMHIEDNRFCVDLEDFVSHCTHPRVNMASPERIIGMVNSEGRSTDIKLSHSN